MSQRVARDDQERIVRLCRSGCRAVIVATARPEKALEELGAYLLGIAAGQPGRFAGEVGHQSADYVVGDIVLDIKVIVQWTIILFRPEMGAV